MEGFTLQNVYIILKGFAVKKICTKQDLDKKNKSGFLGTDINYVRIYISKKGEKIYPYSPYYYNIESREKKHGECTEYYEYYFRSFGVKFTELFDEDEVLIKFSISFGVTSVIVNFDRGTVLITKYGVTQSEEDSTSYTFREDIFWNLVIYDTGVIASSGYKLIRNDETVESELTLHKLDDKRYASGGNSLFMTDKEQLENDSGYKAKRKILDVSELPDYCKVDYFASSIKELLFQPIDDCFAISGDLVDEIYTSH